MQQLTYNKLQPNGVVFHPVINPESGLPLRRKILENLSQFDIRQVDKKQTATRAAVAIVVEARHQQQACIYLTLRSSKLRKHAGQFALPGGKLDEGETVEMAARRELSEELGVTLEEDSVLGKLDDFSTRSGFVITPIILWNNTAAEPLPNEDEVARFYRIPIIDLLDPELADYEDHSGDKPIFSITPSSVGTSVYSPTAAIIYQFREVALLGKDTRVSHYEQPAFAWR